MLKSSVLMKAMSSQLIELLYDLGYTFLNPADWHASIVETGKFSTLHKRYVKIELLPLPKNQNGHIMKTSVILHVSDD
jgi:hypothetical protein